MNHVDVAQDRQKVTLADTVKIMNIDKVVEKLGNMAPTAPTMGEKDYEKQRKYVINVISAAKKNSSLFSQKEMGRVIAADLLMEATTSDEEGGAISRKIQKFPSVTEMPNIDPALKIALKGVAAAVKNSDNYQNALRAGMIAMAGCIPYVGGIVAAVTTVLWPENKISVWDQVKDQVKQVVNMALFNYKLGDLRDLIAAVEKGLIRYLNSSSNQRRGSILESLQLILDFMYEKVNNSDDRHMLLGIMVPIGTLHLTVLSETYNHLHVLYPDENKSKALLDLESKYKEYKEFFDSTYKKWLKVRSDALIVHCKSQASILDPHICSVGDVFGQYNFQYLDSDPSRANGFKKWALNRAIADMADALSATHNYSMFFEGTGINLSPILPELDTIELGPYLWTQLWGTERFSRTSIGDWTNDTSSGELKKINIYAENSIHGIQFIYSDKAGTKVTRGGGASYELDLEGKQCLGAKLNYSSGHIYKMQFFFADGSKSPEYGNKGGWQSVAFADATVGGGYKLALGNFILGSGPSGTTGINGVIFTFKRA